MLKQPEKGWNGQFQCAGLGAMCYSSLKVTRLVFQESPSAFSSQLLHKLPAGQAARTPDELEKAQVNSLRKGNFLIIRRLRLRSFSVSVAGKGIFVRVTAARMRAAHKR